METNKASDRTVIELPDCAGRPAWLEDLAAHKRLFVERKQFAASRSEVLKGIERIEGVADIRSQSDLGVRPLSPAIRLRMALRVAIAKVRNRVAPSPRAVLVDELAFLNASLTEKTGKMHELEARILKADPTSADEARHLLDFISHVVGGGREIEPKHMARLLRRCAIAMVSCQSGQRPANNEQLRRQS